MVKILTKSQIEIIKQEYLNGTNSNELSNQFKVSNVAILGILRRRGIPIRDYSHARQKYAINELFFERIDNEEKAYWLGFICADGYVHFDRNSLVIALSTKDKEHLQKFKECIGSSHPIKEYKYAYSFARVFIRNKKISESLKQYITKKKTFSLTFPKINKDMEWHFIRGYFDGDGSISNGRNPQFGITSNSVFLDNLDERFKQIGMNKTKRDIRHKNQCNIQTIKFVGRNNIKRIYDSMYQNATIFLERKKEIFNKIEMDRPPLKIQEKEELENVIQF